MPWVIWARQNAVPLRQLAAAPETGNPPREEAAVWNAAGVAVPRPTWGSRRCRAVVAVAEEEAWVFAVAWTWDVVGMVEVVAEGVEGTETASAVARETIMDSTEAIVHPAAAGS